ncbi:MAG: radical SAM protein, partial [Candidatus Omnitrophota bacterium]
MKIVFVHFGRENLGIEYLSSVLKKQGYQVELVYDCGLFSREDNVFYSPFLERIFKKKDIVRKVIAKKPDIVAFSVYTTTYKWSCETAIAIKKYIPVPIVFGGIHPTLVPEKVISLPFVDYVIIGEGEYSFLSLVCAVSENSGLGKVDNLYYKKNGKIIQNPLASPIRDLDELPFPDKELFADSVRHKDDYLILTSRGCPFSCSYCCESFLNNLYHDKYFRRRSVESVIKELTTMRDRYRFKEVMFFDSIFFTDKEWLKGLLLRYNKEIGVPFRCTGHVSFFDYEIGRLMKHCGCYCIDFGVQTLNSNIRKEILGRNEDNSQIKKAFTICDELGLSYDVDLIFGLPGTKRDDYELPLDFMKDNKYLNRLKCYYLSYYPRLSLVDKAKALGILDENDLERIEEGDIADWFHLDHIRDQEHREWKDVFEKLYKVYPLFPSSLRSLIGRRKLYWMFHFIPNLLIVFIQLFIAMLHRDHRFKIYIKNYFFHIRKHFF